MKNISRTLLCAAMALSVSMATAGKKGGGGGPPDDSSDPNLEALTVVSTVSSVNGAVGGYVCTDGSRTASADPASCGSVGAEAIIYPISGKVFAPTVNAKDGETVGAVSQVGTIDATAEFSVSFFGLLSEPWETLGVLDWTMDSISMVVNGSTFEHIEGMELDGSAFAALGPVEDPFTSGAASLRMGGCEGIREVSGKGEYAGMIGTLCLNGTFSFQPNFDGKGVSNCTLVLHNPIQ